MRLGGGWAGRRSLPSALACLCPQASRALAAPSPTAPRTSRSAGAGLCRIASGTDLELITSKRGWMLRTPSVTELLMSAGPHTASAR